LLKVSGEVAQDVAFADAQGTDEQGVPAFGGVLVQGGQDVRAPYQRCSLVYNYLRMSSLSGSARRGTVGYNYPQPARAGRRFPGCSVFPVARVRARVF